MGSIICEFMRAHDALANGYDYDDAFVERTGGQSIQFERMQARDVRQESEYMSNASKTESLTQTADGTLLAPAVAARPSLATGAAVVKRYVSKLGNEAGVYRMISADG